MCISCTNATVFFFVYISPYLTQSTLTPPNYKLRYVTLTMLSSSCFDCVTPIPMSSKTILVVGERGIVACSISDLINTGDKSGRRVITATTVNNEVNMDSRLWILGLLLSVLANAGPSSAATLALYNKCRETVWPGIQPSAGKAVLARGGFQLLPNQAYSLRLPAGWSGRVWGRRGCAFDPATGRGRCATGDCGGALYCNGLGGAPPATLAEFTLGQGLQQDFYDVSLVDGYNLGMSMTPFRGSGQCGRAGCVSDLNEVCPAGLAVRGGTDNRVVACKSACSAFGSPRYCCTGSFGGPQQCKPTAYSRLFKAACPRAYSYAYDDPTSILTCTGASYLVTFCPQH